MVFGLCAPHRNPRHGSDAVDPDAGEPQKLAELYDDGDSHDSSVPHSGDSAFDTCDPFSIPCVGSYGGFCLSVSWHTDPGGPARPHGVEAEISYIAYGEYI